MLLSLFVLAINITVNATDVINRPLWYALQPSVVIFGGLEIFLGAFLGVIGGGIFIGTDKNKFITMLYLLVCLFFFSALMSVTGVGLSIFTIFTLLGAFAIASLWLRRMTEKRSEY